jgi:predicted acylesterase/phospholipase RssA
VRTEDSPSPSPSAGRLTVDQARAIVEELRATQYPSSDGLLQECDVVMKGGITSGVVYPLAVCELAKRYRFRNVGGASAGAMAAAFAAAAEKGRDSGGFRKLAAQPEQVGSNLVSLFQPTRGTRPLFRVLLAGVHPRRRGLMKKLGVLGAVIAYGPVGFALGAITVLLLGWWSFVIAGETPAAEADWRGLLPIAIPAVAGGFLGSLFAHYRRACRQIQRNFHGLCSGFRGGPQGGGPPPLTEWLTRTIDDLAGVSDGRGPLTFADLWGPEAVEAWREAATGDAEPVHFLESPADRAERSGVGRAINLEVMTTNVTFGRPMRLPFDTRDFMFCPKEFRDLFPPKVMARLVPSNGASTAETEWHCPCHHEETLWRFPDAPNLPVVVAARMSLSFPVLISAVPLYAVDEGRKEMEDRTPVRCWFSDGGISSNFPIHFFDSLWPGRPTFGVSLAPFHQDWQTSEVYLPPPMEESGPPRVRDTEKLFGFLAAILDTMQNWSDEGQSTLPGYRDRIVEVHLSEEEGGMNLAMPEERVIRLAARGQMAAAELNNFDFEQHRWARYLTAMAKLQQSVVAMQQKYESLADGSPGYRSLIDGPARNGLYHRGSDWRKAAGASTETLLRFAAPRPGDPPAVDFTAGAPEPEPDLRITAHF